MHVVTARIPEKLFREIQKIEKEEHTDRAEAVRKLLSKAVQEWRAKNALELLKEHKITYRKAASLAGIGYVEMLMLASGKGIDIGYSLEDLKRDLS